MTPAPSIEELQARLVDARVFRWEPGVLRTDGTRHATHLRPPVDTIHPVLTDRATLKMVLQQVRVALGDPHTYTTVPWEEPHDRRFFTGSGHLLAVAPTLPQVVALALLLVGLQLDQGVETITDPDQLPLFPDLTPRTDTSTDPQEGG